MSPTCSKFSGVHGSITLRDNEDGNRPLSRQIIQNGTFHLKKTVSWRRLGFGGRQALGLNQGSLTYSLYVLGRMTSPHEFVFSPVRQGMWPLKSARNFVAIIEGMYLECQAYIRHSKTMTIIEDGQVDDKAARLPGQSWLSL